MIIYTKPDIDASQITCTSEFSEHLITGSHKRKGQTDLCRGIQISDTSGENEVAIHKSILQLLLLCLVFLLYLSHDENGISGSLSRHEAKLHVIN